MKKFKFIKLLGFAPLIAVPLVAAGCNGNGTNNPPANQKIIGDYMMKNIVARLGNKENYDFSGVKPTGVTVYQAETTKAFDNASAYNFVNTNGKPVTKDGTTTYTFKGNTAGSLTKSIIPFATVALAGEKEGEATVKVNISISFTIIVKDNTVEKSSSVAIDSSSSAVAVYSFAAEQFAGSLKDSPDATSFEAFFATKNLVNVFNWMYKTKEGTASLAGGATDKDGVVKFPLTTDEKANLKDVNLPAKSELPLPDATTTKALEMSYIAYGQMSFNVGATGVLTIAKASSLGLTIFKSSMLLL